MILLADIMILKPSNGNNWDVLITTSTIRMMGLFRHCHPQDLAVPSVSSLLFVPTSEYSR